jgi:hypothetical protein
VPQLPRRGVGAARSALPAAQHLADLTVQLGQLAPQILGATEQRLSKSVHHQRIDAQIGLGSHSRNLIIAGPRHNSP